MAFSSNISPRSGRPPSFTCDRSRHDGSRLSAWPRFSPRGHENRRFGRDRPQRGYGATHAGRNHGHYLIFSCLSDAVVIKSCDVTSERVARKSRAPQPRSSCFAPYVSLVSLLRYTGKKYCATDSCVCLVCFLAPPGVFEPEVRNKNAHTVR